MTRRITPSRGAVNFRSPGKRIAISTSTVAMKEITAWSAHFAGRAYKKEMRKSEINKEITRVTYALVLGRYTQWIGVCQHCLMPHPKRVIKQST
ncbi:MAG: hypothetical protein HN616_00160 [Proteobacteria bacterium]|nr:hypothetical protein [Pseudomonadota bacterium]